MKKGGLGFSGIERRWIPMSAQCVRRRMNRGNVVPDKAVKHREKDAGDERSAIRLCTCVGVLAYGGTRWS